MWHLRIGSKTLPSSQIHCICRIKFQSCLSFLQSAIDTFVKFTINGKMETLRLFSQTHWTVRASSLTSICENYKELEDLWNWCLVEYKDRKAKARINSALAQMWTSDYFFGLRLGILLLRRSHNLCTSLQAENLCTAEAQKIAKTSVNTLKKKWEVTRNLSFWKDAKNKAAIFDVDPLRLSRKKRAPARIEECLWGSAAPEFNDDVVSHYKICTTSPWIVSSMPSRIDSIRKISKRTSN